LQPVAILASACEETRRRLADIERPVLKIRQRLPNSGRYRAHRMIRICGSIGRTGEPLRRLTKEFSMNTDQLPRRRAKIRVFSHLIDQVWSTLPFVRRIVR
jgi:hypothetical protein